MIPTESNFAAQKKEVLKNNPPWEQNTRCSMGGTLSNNNVRFVLIVLL